MKYTYNATDNCFLINAGEVALHPTLKVIPEYPLTSFDVHFFQNVRKDSAENSIYSVYFDSVRVGWVFPIQSLLSTEHDYAQRSSFLKFAYVAYQALIDCCSDDKLTEEEKNTGEFDIEAHYSSEKSILLLDKDCTNDISSYDFEKYVVGFVVHGYIGENVEILDYHDLELDPISNKLQIKSISPDFNKPQVEYINTLIGTLFPTVKNGFSRFHVLYQVVELLIDCIFRNEMNNLIANYSSYNDVFDLKDRLNEVLKEQYRVVSLCQEYSKISKDVKSELIEECNDILGNEGNNYIKDEGKSIYKTRCLLVHRLYSLSKEAHGRLDTLNGLFLQAIFDLLVNYHS